MSDLEIIWGAPAIAKAIGRDLRGVYHMLENGLLPGARKVGGRWCVTRRSLHALFESEAPTHKVPARHDAVCAA